jgi:hypothetical protein
MVALPLRMPASVQVSRVQVRVCELYNIETPHIVDSLLIQVTRCCYHDHAVTPCRLIDIYQ